VREGVARVKADAVVVEVDDLLRGSVTRAVLIEAAHARRAVAESTRAVSVRAVVAVAAAVAARAAAPTSVAPAACAACVPARVSTRVVHEAAKAPAAGAATTRVDRAAVLGAVRLDRATLSLDVLDVGKEVAITFARLPTMMPGTTWNRCISVGK
jgi:hypothetical protein